jgi:hypothetical protein
MEENYTEIHSSQKPIVLGEREEEEEEENKNNNKKKKIRIYTRQFCS